MKGKLLWIISLGFVLSSLYACMTHPTNAGPDGSATDLTVGKVQGEIKEGMPASDVAPILGSPNIMTTDEKRRDCIAQDGDFCKYADGIVSDTNTGLEWFTGPDRDISLSEANTWVANLTVAGGGWRMPTREELKTLYQKGAGSRNMTRLLKITGWWVWSGETKDSSAAWGFNFLSGIEYWSTCSDSNNLRVFAVRFRR
ncbi:MAG: DUF1566 domain-containing protein [Sedimentisphaerales bacterium]|nr:DUF1566 domain-containing protein [Sedimentisphaerales bacterium]